MAIAAWKRFKKTPGSQRKKRFLKRLIGKELKLRKDIEIPIIKDGGRWFTPEGLSADGIVYSQRVSAGLTLWSYYGIFEVVNLCLPHRQS